MMDFLRRLAPPRETDPARAVAVLPSRFASEMPLRVTVGQPQHVHHVDEDEASLTPETSSVPAVISAFATPRHSVADVRPSQAVLLPLGSELPRRGKKKAISPTPKPAELPNVDAAEPRQWQDQQGVNSERAQPINPELRVLSVSLPATHVFQSVNAPPDSDGPQMVAAPPAQSRPASPLSQGILTQRTLQSRDDNQVVHVTIGRIDVVASAAPAPAARRSPTSRQATVPLAEYLRGGSGSRR